MSEKCRKHNNNNNSDNPLTYRRTDEGNNKISGVLYKNNSLLKTIASLQVLVIFFSILLIHKGSHREVYRDFQPSLTDHKFRAYTPSQHCPIANSASTQSQQPVVL